MEHIKEPKELTNFFLNLCDTHNRFESRIENGIKI